MEITILVAIALLFVGISLVIPAWSIRKKALRFDSWTTERGKVVSVTAKEQPISAQGGKSYMDIVVQYEYRSAGQLRFGSNIAGTFLKTEEEAARRLTDQYGPGNNVTIFCDPEDANHTILKIPVFAWRGSLYIGGTLILVGVVILILRLLGG